MNHSRCITAVDNCSSLCNREPWTYLTFLTCSLHLCIGPLNLITHLWKQRPIGGSAESKYKIQYHLTLPVPARQSWREFLFSANIWSVLDAESSADPWTDPSHLDLTVAWPRGDMKEKGQVWASVSGMVRRHLSTVALSAYLRRETLHFPPP